MVCHAYRVVCKLLLLLITTGCASRTPQEYPRVAAHRADRAAGMDNSEVAIKSAVAAGFPFIEIDVRATQDGGFVLYHDSRFHQRYFASASIEEGIPIEQLTLGALKAERFVDGSGGILTFVEGLMLVRGTTARVLLDIKGATPARVEELMQAVFQGGYEHSVVVQCQSIEVARLITSSYPGIRILARLHRLSDLDEYLALRPFIVQVDPQKATLERVNQIKAAGALVLIKAVDTELDSPGGWRKLKRLGADIVLTDNPAELMQHSGSALELREPPAQ